MNATVHALKPQTFAAPANAIAWFEVPVTDIEKARAFYAAILLNDLADMPGPNPMAAFAYSAEKSAVSGHLYPGKPAAAGTGSTVHYIVPDSVEAGMERVWSAGGKVVSPVIDIPEGRFAYCLDLDGNSFGLFTR